MEQKGKDGKCTHNVTLRRNHCCCGRSELVCSLSYPACNAHAPYCHLWRLCLFHIFPHFLI